MSENPTGYWTDDEVICRGDDTVADIVDGKCKMRPEFRKYAIGAGKFWKEYNASKPVVTAEPLHIPSPQDTVTEAGFVKFHEAVLVHRETGKEATYGEVLGIPPAPEMDPAMGSKTPAYAEWMRKYHPHKWAGMHKDWSGK